MAYLGHLDLLARWLYRDLGTTEANVLVGLISAVVDNIPVMYSVLVEKAEWLLVTLTAGTGGYLSIGSASDIALRGLDTSSRHLLWIPDIAAGYFAAVFLHLLLYRGAS